MTKEEFVVNRKAAGNLIDVETCEIEWWYVQTLDPYGLDGRLPDELWQVERGYFVQSAESDGWVHVCDLPDGKASALYARLGRIRRGLEQYSNDDVPF